MLLCPPSLYSIMPTVLIDLTNYIHIFFYPDLILVIYSLILFLHLELGYFNRFLPLLFKIIPILALILTLYLIKRSGLSNIEFIPNTLLNLIFCYFTAISAFLLLQYSKNTNIFKYSVVGYVLLANLLLIIALNTNESGSILQESIILLEFAAIHLLLIYYTYLVQGSKYINYLSVLNSAIAVANVIYFLICKEYMHLAMMIYFAIIICCLIFCLIDHLCTNHILLEDKARSYICLLVMFSIFLSVIFNIIFSLKQTTISYNIFTSLSNEFIYIATLLSTIYFQVKNQTILKIERILIVILIIMNIYITAVQGGLIPIGLSTVFRTDCTKRTFAIPRI